MRKKIYLMLLLLFLAGCSSEIKTLGASLGEPFTLVKGQSARIQDQNNSITIQIKEFVYSPCPKGANCFWSGLAVFYSFDLNGKNYDSYVWNTPYNLDIVKTDYKKFATFIVTRAESDCEKKSNEHYDKDECWRQLSARINDTSFCNSIMTKITKDACFEDMARILDDKTLCRNVIIPTNYCLS